MGRGAAQCIVGLLNNSKAIHRGNSIFLDIWSRSCDTNWDKPMQCTGRWIWFCLKQLDDGRMSGFARWMPGGSDHSVSWISTKPCSALQPRCEDKIIQCWGPSAEESSRQHARHKCRKAGPYLGRTLLVNCYRRRGGILPGMHGGATVASAMERSQLEKILSLINCTRGCKTNVI